MKKLEIKKYDYITQNSVLYDLSHWQRGMSNL